MCLSLVLDLLRVNAAPLEVLVQCLLGFKIQMIKDRMNAQIFKCISVKDILSLIPPRQLLLTSNTLFLSSLPLSEAVF